MHNEESLLAFAEETLNEAKAIMYSMLTKVVEIGSSDLFITADFPPSVKHQGLMKPLGKQILSADKTKLFAYSIMNDYQRDEFEREMECNFAINVPEVSRFRVNVFVQQQQVGMVIRTIAAEIPNFEIAQHVKRCNYGKTWTCSCGWRYRVWKIHIFSSDD